RRQRTGLRFRDCGADSISGRGRADRSNGSAHQRRHSKSAFRRASHFGGYGRSSRSDFSDTSVAYSVGCVGCLREGTGPMTIAAIKSEVKSKLDSVRATLANVMTGGSDVCLTCSFQAEDVLLTRLAIDLDPNLPILFLDTGYHFSETYAYRDEI